MMTRLIIFAISGSIYMNNSFINTAREITLSDDGAFGTNGGHGAKTHITQRVHA
jgi:hypothetical protein